MREGFSSLPSREAPCGGRLRGTAVRRDRPASATQCAGADDRGRELLETTRISNDPEYLRAVMERAGECPEVVLEACYGWYWAADTLAQCGAAVHLAHPLGVKGFAYRRV